MDMATTISRATVPRIAPSGHSVQMAGSGDRNSEQAEAGCLGHRRGARTAAELVPYVRHVAMHGVRADHELRRDLAVVQPVRDKRKHLPLSGGQKHLGWLTRHPGGL